MGRYLERADMNTRILDAGTSLMMQAREEESIRLGQVVWSKVLKSQSAYLDYRRTMRAAISGAPVVSFLLTDPYFPRSQRFCFEQIREAAERLPRAGIVAISLHKLLDQTRGVEQSEAVNAEFSDYLNEVQLGIMALHHQISENWFYFHQEQAA